MGLMDRFRRPTAPEPTEEMLDLARSHVLTGFTARDDVVQVVGEILDLEDDPRVASAVDRVWSRRLAEQATWTTPGQHASVEAAFARLEGEGIVARMAFACCQRCGTDEIDDERTPDPDAAEGGYRWNEWAYTFFHQQDAEQLADAVERPVVLQLSYSAFTPLRTLDAALVAAMRAGDERAARTVREETDSAVGRAVVGALRDEGLEVRWNGRHTQRIGVVIDDWRKPLPVPGDPRATVVPRSH